MKLVTRVNLFVITLLVISLGGAMLSIWSARQAHVQIERINLAHDVYEGFLSLESHTYQLFKQYGDALLIGDLDEHRGEAELIGKIRADVARIRSAIGLEIELVGEEEIEELSGLAAIERKIEQLIASLGPIARVENIDEWTTSWRALSEILDGEIDQEFRTLIDEALAEEAEEVVETKIGALADLRTYQLLAGLFAGLALAFSAVGMARMYYRVIEPVRHLHAGMTAFTRGEADFRFRTEDSSELGDIGRSFDLLADQVTARTDDLARQKASLQEAVEERTARLGELLERARHSETTRRRMIADVSHELRTPLTIIKGEAEVALRGGDKPLDVYKEALVRTRDAADHTARLVDDLLFVARNESGELRMTKETLDLASVVREVTATFGGDPKLEIAIEPALIHADAARLRQVLVILLDNARQHGGSEVLVRLHDTPDGFRLAVEDNGPGMSEAERQHAFERFYRGSNAAARYRDGVGLGLPVALAIAEAHGGTIELGDRPGGGLVAALRLPGRPRLRAVS